MIVISMKKDYSINHRFRSSIRSFDLIADPLVSQRKKNSKCKNEIKLEILTFINIDAGARKIKLKKNNNKNLIKETNILTRMKELTHLYISYKVKAKKRLKTSNFYPNFQKKSEIVQLHQRRSMR